jgi:hypothetical protein
LLKLASLPSNFKHLNPDAVIKLNMSFTAVFAVGISSTGVPTTKSYSLAKKSVFSAPPSSSSPYS